jgi:hypothetical protein
MGRQRFLSLIGMQTSHIADGESMATVIRYAQA